MATAALESWLGLSCQATNCSAAIKGTSLPAPWISTPENSQKGSRSTHRSPKNSLHSGKILNEENASFQVIQYFVLNRMDNKTVDICGGHFIPLKKITKCLSFQ